MAKTAVLVSDGAQAYGAYARDTGLPHVALNLSAGERSCGIYHIQNVNNYGSRLKTWMRRFNGVATKYLDSWQKAPEMRIVEQSIWDAVQAKRAERGGKHLYYKRRQQRLLSGLLRCACCRGTYSVVRDNVMPMRRSGTVT